ncbi:two pore domain potassium channel family protein [Schaalia sp. 19OD2882]|uniref:potassium channel family protein n=1 Tax=Schaalia sp. 19OD2882 TaxID=2794089 RepID=UPI001C1EEA68|nr:ion channel [Schaalia sp. 19OD2882]QWW20213.1 two pore domain potassium channel family protein [Schaalia sp. 19OD2882]
MFRHPVEHLVVAILIIGAFYVLPVHPGEDLPLRSGLSVVLLVGLAAVVVRQLRYHSERIGRLVTVFIAAVALLALTCYAVSVHQPGQFVGLETRTDALYFTITTISTVGYGDIHPVGQTARALVTTMIIFDVVFLGALAAAVSDNLRRARQAASRGEDGSRDGADEGLSGPGNAGNSVEGRESTGRGIGG